MRDSVVKDGTVKTIQLDRSQTQLLHDVKFKDELDIKTTKEFVKTSHDQEVTAMPFATED